MTTDTTTPDAAAGAAATLSLGRLATWRYVLNTANLPAGMTKPDAISKWLVITRAAVFSMTARRASDTAGHPGRVARPAGRTSVDDRVLPDHRGRSARRLDRAVGGARAARAAAPRPGAAHILETAAGIATTQLRGLALWFVGGAFIHTRRAGGCSCSASCSTRCCQSTCHGSRAGTRGPGLRCPKLGAGSGHLFAPH